MNNDNAGDALLNGGSGSPTCKFPNVGDKHVGTVLDIQRVQQTTVTGEPKFFKSGDPMMQFVIELQTDERDDSDDDGKRRLFTSYKCEQAVRDALQAAGVTDAGAIVGGLLAVQHTGVKALDGGRTEKQYRAEFKPGAPAGASLLGAGNTADGETAGVSEEALI